MEPHAFIVGNFNTPILPMDTLLKQKQKKMELTDGKWSYHIYTEHFMKMKDCTFVFAPYGTFSKTDHILGHKPSLNR